MAGEAWLHAHRELQYLRAAAKEGPRRSRYRRQRRAYADVRWSKLMQIERRKRRR
jgi:hypothetical protein